MARITGKSLYLTFGSTVLSTDFQTLDVSDNANLVSIVAGNDTVETFATTYTSATASYKGLYDATNGPTIEAAVVPNTAGTLTWSPQGTATGKEKRTATAIVNTKSTSNPFDGAIELNVEFQINSAITLSTW